MDTPRSALRDRSNDDEFLVRGLVDHQGEATTKPSLAAGSTQQQSGRDPAAAVGADDPACANKAAVPIVTPEPPQPAADTTSSAAPAGASQPRDGGATRTGDTHARSNGISSHAASSSRRARYSSCINPVASRPRPPPPVACTLVAFEPGSLGLELEAIVDEEAKMAQRGGKYRDHHRRGHSSSRRRPRRLGCRVFRVTPGGQAARHGSVHPGDALVVLDG